MENIIEFIILRVFYLIDLLMLKGLSENRAIAVMTVMLTVVTVILYCIIVWIVKMIRLRGKPRSYSQYSSRFLNSLGLESAAESKYTYPNKQTAMEWIKSVTKNILLTMIVFALVFVPLWVVIFDSSMLLQYHYLVRMLILIPLALVCIVLLLIIFNAVAFFIIYVVRRIASKLRENRISSVRIKRHKRIKS